MSGNTSETRCKWCDRPIKSGEYCKRHEKHEPTPPEGEAVPEQSKLAQNLSFLESAPEEIARMDAAITDKYMRYAAPGVSTAAPERVELTIDEKLVILMEECAEVIKAASKCLRFGFNREQEGYGQNDKVLSGETGDLLGMVDSLPLDQALIGFCRKRKLCKAEKAKAEYGK